MKIEKEYNVQMLANIVKKAIEITSTRGANIDIITAQGIVDVLETVASWENKRTEPTDIKKEALKKECFGCHINGDGKCNLCVDEKECMTETNPMKAEKKCFGCFDGNDIECCMCDDMKQCEEETNRKPDCFGNYEEEDGWDDSCDECMYAKECKKSFINKKKQREGITINE